MSEINLSPQGRETLADILRQFKNGTITMQESAESMIIDLFRHEPVNYKRVYSEPSGEPKGPTMLPVKGQLITLGGFADQNGTYKVLNTENQPGSSVVNMQLQRVEAKRS